MTKYISRRDFMRQTGGAAGATLAAKTILVDPPAGHAQNQAAPPSDRIRIGIIGVGEQGAGLLRNAIFHKGVECVAACDLWDGRHTLAREIVGKPIKVTRRYQDLLDDKEIDCIINATPDHWHKQILVDCCKAGKDVYSEKPMSHDVGEGFEMIRAAEENKRIVEIGAQSASSWTFNKAKELIAHGAIGDLHTIEASTGRNTPNGAWASWMPPPGLSPANLDWETWLGNTPKIPFDPIRFTRWRSYRAFGTGVAGDLMVHLLTGMHLASGVTAPPQRALAVGALYVFKEDGREAPDVHHVLYDYPNFKASRAEESHPRALPEPYVNLSAHTAPSVQPLSIQKRPVSKEIRRGPDHPCQPIPRNLRPLPQTLELAACPPNQKGIDPTERRIEF